MSDPYSEEKTPLLIEFTTTQEGLTPVRNIPWPNRDELEEKSNKAIDKAMTVIQSTAEKVNSAIKNVEGHPDHVEVEFGIKFDAEVGVILAKASMEASLNVTLTWDNVVKAEPRQSST
jgi:hypothetical protein